MVRRDLALELLHHAGALLRARDHAVDGLVHGAVVDQLGVGAGGQQRGLVHHVGELRTREARGPLGHGGQVHVLGQRLGLGVHAQDLLAALHVRGVHADLTVEPARAQQRGVQDVRAVGRGDQDHVGVRVEAVHLHQELVQRLLALVVAAAHAGAALAAHGVDLVHEDDRGGVLLGLLEEVPHAGGTHAHEHLHEVRAGDGVERHAGLTRHGLGQQGLARAGRTVEQHTLGHLGAHRGEAVVLHQELLDLVELLHGLVRAGHVRERDLGVLLVEHLGLGAAKLHGLPAGLHAGEDEPEQAHDDQEREQEAHQGQEPVVLHRLVGEALQIGLVHGLDDLFGSGLHVVELHLLAQVLVTLVVVLLEGELHLLLAVVDLGLVDLALVQQLEAHVGVHTRSGGAEEAGAHGHQDHNGQEDPEEGTSKETGGFFCRGQAVDPPVDVSRSAAVHRF